MFIQGAVAFLVHAAAFRVEVHEAHVRSFGALQLENASRQIANTSGLENSSGLENTSGVLNTGNLDILNPLHFSDFEPLGAGMKGETKKAKYLGRTVVIKTAKAGHEHQLIGSGTGDIEIFTKIQRNAGLFEEGWPSGVVRCIGLLRPCGEDPCPSPGTPCVVMEYVDGGPLGTLTQAVKDAVIHGLQQGRFGNTTDEGECADIIVQNLFAMARRTVADLTKAGIKKHDKTHANFVVPLDPAELLRHGIVWIDVGHEARGSDLQTNLETIRTALQQALRMIREDIQAAIATRASAERSAWWADAKAIAKNPRRWGQLLPTLKK